MQPALCSRCGKNVAVIFITKLENGQAKNEGLCLKCARELHIKPVDDIINKMGLSDEDLAYLSQIMDSGVNLAGAALSLLPVRQYGPLLENVVYLGLPAVFAAVKTGRFRAGAKEFPRKENPS